MVAYSFKRQFADPIRAETKQQTIRADRKRHARPGELLQLYCGMRTRGCFLIGHAICLSAWPIALKLNEPRVLLFENDETMRTETLDEFARRDGFRSWGELDEFWRKNHPDVRNFSGVLIRWHKFRLPIIGEQDDARAEIIDA